jgi:hypothetical protein
LTLKNGADLFMKTAYHRFGLLIGQEVPEGRATKKSGLIGAGHEKRMASTDQLSPKKRFDPCR